MIGDVSADAKALAVLRAIMALGRALELARMAHGARARVRSGAGL